MRVVRIEDVPLVVRKTVRSDIQYRSLLTGMPGTLGNFKLILGRTNSDYVTPRHRHNFDQIRFQTEGEFKFEEHGVLDAGAVGYFPEGTPYGPQYSGDNCENLLLQFGGASGSGYMSDDEYNAAMAELKKVGEFHDGIFTGKKADGQKYNKDGYEAVWEQSRGRRVEYPPLRYSIPVLMYPKAFPWMKTASRGVSYKELGSFTECKTRVGFIRIESGASTSLQNNSLFYVVSGKGSINQQKWLPQTVIYVEQNERADLQADENSEIFHIGLPDLSHLEGHRPATARTAA